MLNNSFLQNIIVLFKGNLIAQFIPLLITPILTRIYSTEEFGMLAVFISLVTILGILSTGAYEMAITLPKKNSDALKLVQLSSLFSLLVSIFLYFIIIIFEHQILNVFEDKISLTVLYLIPFAVFFTGIYQSLVLWNNRKKNFKTISNVSIIQSFFTNVMQVFLSVFSIGLILGRVIGQIASVFYLIKPFFYRKKLGIKINILKKIALIKRYKKFPLFDTWSRLFTNSANEVPILLISILFSSAMAGLYLLAYRVLLLPVSTLGLALSHAYLQKASKVKSENSKLHELSFKIFKKLILISVLPSAILIVFGKDIFSFIFGTSWGISGIMVQILSPLIFIYFVTSFLTNLFIVLEKQKEAFYFSLLIFISQVLALYIGYLWFNNIYGSIFSFVIVGIIIRLLWTCYIFKKIDVTSITVLVEIFKYIIPLVIILFLIKG